MPSPQQPPPQPPPSSSAPATTADNNNDTNIDTNNLITIRGRIIRKRKYHDHISFAIRSLISSNCSSSSSTSTILAPPILIMIPRNDPSFSLDGIFIGTIIEATVEKPIDETVESEAEATAVVEAATTETETETTTVEKNKNKSNNNKNHQLAKSFKIIGCSPDPNAIQVCLNLVFGSIGVEKGDESKSKNLLPVSIFSYYDHDSNNSNNSDNNNDGCKSRMIPLFRDDEEEVILNILKLNSKDPIVRKNFISRLSRALKGEDKNFTLVKVENNDSSEVIKNDGPRKRLTHVKHRQKLVLQKMEVSQSPLEHVLRTITVDGDDDDGNDGRNDDNDDDEKESTTKVIASSSLSEPSLSEKGIVVVPNIPKVDPNNTNDGSSTSNTMNMMSIRHPRTRIDYLIDKKYPQIQWLLQRMSPIIDKIRNENERRRNNNNDNNGKEDEEEEEQQYSYINVLDVGGGRGDIAVAVAQEFHDVKVTVVDMNESSLQAGKDYYEESMKVAAKNRKNSDTTNNNNTTEIVHDNENNTDTRAHFICDDFAHFAKDAFHSTNNNNSNRSSKAITFDIVIAWHACGDLSDYALEYSIRSNVKAFLINPCCYTKRYIKTFTPKYILQYYNYCSPVAVDKVDNVNPEDVNHANDVNEVNNANANNMKESAPEATTTTATTIATTTTNTTTTTAPFDNEGRTKNTNTDTKTDTTIMTTNEFKTKNNYNKNGRKSNDNSYGKSKNNNQQDNNQQDKYPPQDKNQQPQQVKSNNDIKIIQKLAEINERPEYTSRAMRLINTMRIKSLLVLQNELNLNSKPSTTTTTPTATATATGTSLSSSSSSSLLFDITLEEYNIEYSSKNLVLVGIK